jgi:hypothetical protein
VRAINAAGRLLGSATASLIRLDEAYLLERAARPTGLDDFGDVAFREPLRRLITAWEEESALIAIGRFIVQGETLRTLQNRLFFTRSWRAIPNEIGEDWAERIAGGITRTMNVRERAAAGSAGFMDIYFDEFVADPIAAVKRIYAAVDRELSAPAEASMRAFLAAHPQAKDGMHEYTLGGAGLDLTRERRRFAAYESRFGIRQELART